MKKLHVVIRCLCIVLNFQLMFSIGLVEKERARQILHRYNVLYGLSLSEEKMAEALEKFGVKDHVTLGPVLLFLKDL